MPPTTRKIKIMLVVAIVVVIIFFTFAWIFRSRLENLFKNSGSLKTSMDKSEMSYSNRSNRSGSQGGNARPGQESGDGEQQAGFFNYVTSMFKSTPTPAQDNQQENDETAADDSSSHNEKND